MHRTLHVRADGRYERGARSSELGARSSELACTEKAKHSTRKLRSNRKKSPPPYVCLCAEGVATGDL